MTDIAVTIGTIPSAKVDQYADWFALRYPNTEMTKDDLPVAKYTNKQWVLEFNRRRLKEDIRLGHQKEIDSALTMVDAPEDIV